MTEYAIPSQQAYREFMSARERTAYWVQRHGPLHDNEYYPPSIAPSVSDGFVPSAPLSDAGSTHSTPPKMVLRYGDGRPDIPIPVVPHGASPSRSQQHSVDRTGSGSSAGHSRSSHSRHPDAPEEIRIYPSASKAKSQSRSASVPRADPADRSFHPSTHMQGQSYRHHTGHSTSPHHQVSFVQPPHHVHPRGHHPKHPPAPMMYPHGHPNGRQPLALAPSHGVYHHPPQMGPNGMIYSHSAPPIPGQHPSHYPTPYPSGSGSHRHTASAHDVRSHHIHAPPMGRSGGRRGASAVSLGSENSSGNTYYVLPAQGHNGKVHVIAPSPEQSVVTATSTTKSSSSQGKKPFFQRLFGFKFSSAASSVGGGGKLSRRHSIGSSGRG
ncbi:hypothetical protein BJ165DRAFT_839566 [Panaeolus papilionaceus]|nr:hypothetical protein BJ165DRAFT_839566 [Panaeolus papilionaceus]